MEWVTNPLDKSVELNEIVRSSMVAGEKEYISMLRDENNKLRDDNNKLRGDIKELRDDNNKLRDDIKELRDDNNKLQDDNKSQAKDMQILRKRLTKQRSEEEWEDSSLTSESMMTVKNPMFK